MPPLEIETRAIEELMPDAIMPAPRKRQRSTGVHITAALPGNHIAGQSFGDTHEKDAGSEAARVDEAPQCVAPPRKPSRRKAGAADQGMDAARRNRVSGELIADHPDTANQKGRVRKRRGQTGADIHSLSVPPQALKETYRKRQDILQAETALTLRIRAVCRRLLSGDKDAADKLYDAMHGKGAHDYAAPALAHCEPLILARETLIEARKNLDKALEKLAKQHRLWPWAEGIRGLGPLSFGQLMGELGVDPGEYRSPAAIWKRMGLAVIDGGRQRCIAGAEAALLHGYSPKRRSLMFVIGDNMLRAGNVEFRALYLARKEIEAAKMPDASKMHIHRRAKRYAEKRLLRDLWRAARPAVHRDPVNPSFAATDADARALRRKLPKRVTPASSATNTSGGAIRHQSPEQHAPRSLVPA